MLSQHFGAAERDCSSSDLENISTGEEGTVEAPAAADTCGMLAFRPHSGNKSWCLSPGVIPSCFPWCLGSGCALLDSSEL